MSTPTVLKQLKEQQLHMAKEMQRLIQAYNQVTSACAPLFEHAQQVSKNLQLIMTNLAALASQIQVVERRCSKHLPPDSPPLVASNTIVPTTLPSAAIPAIVLPKSTNTEALQKDDPQFYEWLTNVKV